MTAPMKAGSPRARASRRGYVATPPAKSRDHTTQHTIMVDRIRLALGLVPDLVLWSNPVKRFQAVTQSGSLIWVRTGLAVGSSDLIGILASRFIGLEVKTGDADAEPHQEQWMQLVRSMGGFACVVRDPKDAMQALDRARAGEFQ